MGIESANYLIRVPSIDLADAIIILNKVGREQVCANAGPSFVIEDERGWIDMLIHNHYSANASLTCRIALCNPPTVKARFREVAQQLLHNGGAVVDLDSGIEAEPGSDVEWQRLMDKFDARRLRFFASRKPFEAAISGDQVFRYYEDRV